MRIKTLWALVLALLAAPVRAVEVRVAPVAGLSAASASAGAAAAVLAAPAASLRSAAAFSAAAARAPSAAFSAAASAAAPADARPLAGIVAAHAARQLQGAFIQNEQEGSLIASDPRDSSGDVFRYYRPAELRPELVASAEGGLQGLSRALYAARRFFQFGRKTPEGAWRALPVSGKLAYLDSLERAVTAERGPAAAWNGKESLLLVKTAAAPDFAAAHPHMEAPPEAYREVPGARFLQPEIVSDKSAPAASVEQALGRTRLVVGDTGHAGTQYHVFVKAAPEVLRAQAGRLTDALQLVNDVLFAKAAAESGANITHGSLMPWHAGRSARVKELLSAASPDAHNPAAGDLDSEKHAFVGLRWWGLEEGEAVASLELRGASIPFKRAPGSAVHGADSPSLSKRDYSDVREHLTVLALYAEALARGAAPAVAPRRAVLSEAAAEEYMNARARALGVPVGGYDGLAALARRLTGAKAVPPGYLFPFAASAPDSPALRAFADETVKIAASVKAAEDAGRGGDAAHYKYLFWSAYREWALDFGARANAELAGLARATAQRR